MKDEILKEFFVETNGIEGVFQVDGIWYAPKFGCDTLSMVFEKLASKSPNLANPPFEKCNGCEYLKLLSEAHCMRGEGDEYCVKK